MNKSIWFVIISYIAGIVVGRWSTRFRIILAKNILDECERILNFAKEAYEQSRQGSEVREDDSE